MQTPTHESLRKLVSSLEAPCLTVCLPRPEGGRDAMQIPIILKDLAREADRMLLEYGLDKREAAAMIAPLHGLIEGNPAEARPWSWALLASRSGWEVLRSNVDLDAGVYVGEHFHLQPLAACLEDRRFFVLAVSRHAVRLIECDAERAKIILLPQDVETSMDAAIRPGERHETVAVRRTGNPHNPSSGGAGTGGDSQDLQAKLHEDLMFFLRQVANGVSRALKDSDGPIVLAGDESILPHFRQASRLKNLADEEIRGNHDHTATESLAFEAAALLEPFWLSERLDLQERYGMCVSRGLGSDDLAELLSAAEGGRVDTLLVAAGGAPAPPSDDVSAILHHTLLCGGRLVPIPAAEMPTARAVAGIFRYAAQAQAAS